MKRLDYAILRDATSETFWVASITLFNEDETIFDFLIDTTQLEEDAQLKGLVDDYGLDIRVEVDRQDLIIPKFKYMALQSWYQKAKKDNLIFYMDYNSEKGLFFSEKGNLYVNTGVLFPITPKQFKEKKEKFEGYKSGRVPLPKLSNRPDNEHPLSRKLNLPVDEFFMENPTYPKYVLLNKSKSLIVWVSEIAVSYDTVNWIIKRGVELYAQDFWHMTHYKSSATRVGNLIRMKKKDLGTIYIHAEDYQDIVEYFSGNIIDVRFLKDITSKEAWWIRRDGRFDKDTGEFFKVSGRQFDDTYALTMLMRKVERGKDVDEAEFEARELLREFLAQGLSSKELIKEMIKFDKSQGVSTGHRFHGMFTLKLQDEDGYEEDTDFFSEAREVQEDEEDDDDNNIDAAILFARRKLEELRQLRENSEEGEVDDF